MIEGAGFRIQRGTKMVHRHHRHLFVIGPQVNPPVHPTTPPSSRLQLLSIISHPLSEVHGPTHEC